MKHLLLTLTLITSVFLSFARLNMEQLGHLSYSDELNDIWGYTDEVGNEYALVGTYSGLSVVDVTDPANPAEVFFGAGPSSIWRDIKTWGDYAYVSNETGQGVYIVDLSPLPNGTITNSTFFSGETYTFGSVHNLYIDESGKRYIFGANNGSGGAIICDLTADPMNPVELGRFNDFYLHDGMARGDTLWGGAIYQGTLAAIDVSNPAAPQLMGSVSTPGQFCHNAWVSDNGSHVFTTDEVGNGYITAYDVTDLNNMTETDRVQSSPGMNVIPHNVHVLNDYLISSYYTDGVTVHDASHPSKLIEVGHFDTSAGYSGGGYHGAWGAYPFLPSGHILVSDIEDGLYILSIDYIRASFVEGVVTDSLTGDPLFDVSVQILGSELSTQTAFDGTFDFGALISGTFDIKFTKEGYTNKVVENVEIISGQVVEVNVALSTLISGIDISQQFSKLSMYPNPFKNNMTLDYELAGLQQSGQYYARIYNTLGHQLAHYELSGTSGKSSFGNDLSSGIYLISISDKKGVILTRRMIKL